MKKIKEHLKKENPDRLEAFETGANAYAKKILANIKDYDFVSLSISFYYPF